MLELPELKARRARIAEERTHQETRLATLRQQEQDQQRQALWQATAEEFCRNITGALQNPSFETKQRILRLVVDTIVVDDEQITIKHLIPISNVHLRRYH